MTDTLPARPKAVNTGMVEAFVLAGLCLVAIPLAPPSIIPCAVFLAIAFGLRRGYAWSGYGGALFLAARWAADSAGMARFGAVSALWWVSLILATVFTAAIAYPFFLAGRALSRNGQRSSPWGWIALAALTLLAPQVFRAFVIPTGSMEETLLIGDQILVGVLGGSKPSRGGIVVFRYPVDIRQTHVKRCMGVPGDRIKIVNKQVILNGRKLDEPYACHKTDYIDAYRDNFPSDPNVHIYDAGRDMLDHHVVNGEVVVPPENYFVMGDNRDASLDSRYWGFVRRANFIGTPWIVYWSYAAPTQATGGSADDILDRYRYFFTRTRWRRILMPVHGYPVN
jgi:signal peptidase I